MIQRIVNWFNQLINILVVNNMEIINDKEYVKTYLKYYMRPNL